MRMTDEQRKLVEDNHNLIYGFLNKKELDIDYYYDIVAIGLCNAAMTYDLTKGKFSTFAYGCMNRELKIYNNYLNRKKSVPEDIVYSYNVKANEDVSESIIDAVIEDSNNNIDYSTETISFNYFLNTLKDRERLIIEHLKNGLTQQEIAKELNRSQQAISLKVKEIRKRWERYSNR